MNLTSARIHPRTLITFGDADGAAGKVDKH